MLDELIPHKKSLVVGCKTLTTVNVNAHIVVVVVVCVMDGNCSASPLRPCWLYLVPADHRRTLSSDKC